MPQVHSDSELVQDEEMLSSYIGTLIRQCEDWSEYQKEYRQKSLEYYNGDMKDLTSKEWESTAISNDLRATYKKLMPSIMRTFFASDRIVDYVATSPRHEEYAEQATRYMNYVIVNDKKCGVQKAINDAIFDALIVRTGILSWEAYEEKKIETIQYAGQSPESMFGLEGQDIELTDVEEYTDEQTGQPAVDFTVRRTVSRTRIQLYAVPRGSFLIMPEMDSIEESPIVGERLQMTRSELISRGYDRNLVEKISSQGDPRRDGDGGYDDNAAYQGDDYAEYYRREIAKAQEEVTVYKLYVKLDRDGDGISELYKMLVADAKADWREGAKDSRYVILHDEMVAEAPYAEVLAEMEPHQFEGHSLSEDIMPVQKIKTTLVREALNNVYWQNNLQPAIDRSALEELDGVLEPEFGRPIWLKRGTDVRQAVQWRETPNISTDLFNTMEMMDNLNREHTGVTDAAGGVDLDKFQSMAPTNAALISEIGAAAAETMIRTLAQGGVREAFRGLLKLVITHGDRNKAMRLGSGEWVTYDPRVWDSNMDCVINIGLGTGSRERDALALNLIKQNQAEIVSALGVDNPFVTPVQVYNTLEGIVEAAGFPSAAPYFTKPTDESIQQLMQKQQQAQQQSPEMVRAQTQMQIAQMKMQGDAQKNMQQLQIERAQLEADITVKRDELEGKMQLEHKKAEDHMKIELLKVQLEMMMAKHKLAVEQEKAAIDIQKMYQEGQLQFEQAQMDLQNKREENQITQQGQQQQLLMKGQEHQMKMREKESGGRTESS